MGSNQFAAFFNLDWSPLVTSNYISFIFAGLLFFSSIFLLIFESKVELREKLMIIFFFFLSLKLNRFSPVLITVLIPAFIFFLEEVKKRAPQVFKQLRVTLILAAVFLLVTYSGRAFDYLWRMKKAYSDEASYAKEMPRPYTYPYAAVEYLKNNPVGERILNDYNWGGYLIWKLPERKFFIDGRMDNFFVNGESFAKEQWRVVNLQPEWEAVLEKYQIDAVLLSPEWPVAQALRISPKWKLLFEDETTVLFEKAD